MELATVIGYQDMRERDELQHIQNYLRGKIRGRMQELGMNPAELSRRIGSPRSTIKSIIDSDSNRLPHLYTLIMIARTLSMSIDELLPKNLVHLSEKHSSETTNFIPPSKLDPNKFLLLLKKYNLNAPILYHPRSIPEFCKSPSLLSAEYEIPAKAATTYQESLIEIFSLNTNGTIAVDGSIIEDLIDRKGFFESQTRSDSLQMIESLKQFEKMRIGRVKVIVVNRQLSKLDPILILSKKFAISDYFGSLLLIADEKLINHAFGKFEKLQASMPTFGEWLKKI